jgi:hypothetical protein
VLVARTFLVRVSFETGSFYPTEGEALVSTAIEAENQAPAVSEVPVAENQVVRQTIEVNDKNAISSYANFCRVTGTPEELIIDFGLNPQPVGIPTQPVVVSQRIVTNFYTAKRLWHALGLTLQRHEQAFGVLETDIQRRLVAR